MPRITYTPPLAQRSTLSAREQALVDLMLALLNEIRAELGLPPRTHDEAVALVQAQKERS
jgi:hypothetical protein